MPNELPLKRPYYISIKTIPSVGILVEDFQFASLQPLLRPEYVSSGTVFYVALQYTIMGGGIEKRVRILPNSNTEKAIFLLSDSDHCLWVWSFAQKKQQISRTGGGFIKAQS